MKKTTKRKLIAYYSRKGSNYFDERIINLLIGNTELIAKGMAIK